MTRVQPAGPDDTPRAAVWSAERTTLVTVAVVLVGLAALAWWLTVRQSAHMAGLGLVHMGMDMGMGMDQHLEAPVFMAMWLTMMVAMMFPTVLPMVLAHRMVVGRRGEGALPSIAFVGGYLAVWTAVGLVPLGVLLGVRRIAMDAMWLPRAAGVVLLVCGAYQFMPWKTACLRACRSPMGFLMTHDFRTGAPGAFRAGVSHGLWCLGCCWALMVVLVVVGLMNIVWMAAIALVFLAEKNWKHGVALTKVAGTAVALLGLAVLLRPDILGTLSSS